MAVREFEISAYSVVLLGNFNPVIFTPNWFEKWGLLTEDEAANAEVSVIHPDITRFAAGGLTVQVELNRFSASGTQSAIKIKDFVLKTFRDYLSHTPIRSIGINREVHYRLPNVGARVKLGRSLAPLAPWGEFGREMEEKPGKEVGGLLSITMHRQKEGTEIKGHVQATVQPSAIIPRNVGVFFQINDHSEALDESNSSEVILRLAGLFVRRVHQAKREDYRSGFDWD
ncbi:hypothetical protein ACQ5SK_43565 [Bradyrhizobium japonicum]